MIRGDQHIGVKLGCFDNRVNRRMFVHRVNVKVWRHTREIGMQCHGTKPENIAREVVIPARVCVGEHDGGRDTHRILVLAHVVLRDVIVVQRA